MTQNIAILRNVGGFTFDGTFKETHESELEISDNPVETGVIISDNAFMKPLKVTISAGVSDTPLYLSASDPFSAGSRRSVTCLQLLQQLQASAEPFTVVTGLRSYDNMVIPRISADTDKDTDAVLIFELQLREIIVVSTQVVTYPPRAKGSTSRQAGAKKQKGEQQAKEQPAAKSSVLSKFFTMLSGGSK